MNRGIASATSIVSGDYSATQSQTRNIIFNIRRQNEKSLFIKQINNFEHTNLYVLQKDATCLWFIKNEKAFKSLTKYVPEYFGYDADNQVLITELIDDSRDLESYSREHKIFSSSLLEKLALMFRAYHFPLKEKTKSARPAQFFPNHIPWSMDSIMLKSPEQQKGLSFTSYPNPVIHHVVNNPIHLAHIESTRMLWNPVGLIHGDIKWLNILISHENADPELHLIDWEIADIGDPLWDIAGVFQGFINNHLFHNVPSSTSQSINYFTGLDQLDNAWKYCGTFWSYYKSDNDNLELKKALRYTAARLIQTATEYNMAQAQLNPSASALLQVSMAIFENIHELMKKLNLPVQGDK